MVQNITIDLGIREYMINGHSLKLNPADPNLYARFFDAQEKLASVENDLVERGKSVELEPDTEQRGRLTVQLMTEADSKAKELLAWIFPGNDFDVILDGINSMAVAGNGERVLTNLVAALQPIIEEGVKMCSGEKIDTAVATAQANRAMRRAAAKS